MKKPQFALLFTTIVFCAFVLGVCIGRSQRESYHSVSNSAQSTESADLSGNALQNNFHEASGKVNINTATKAQLMLLPGIGETLAQRILDYRQKIGTFHSTDELLLVEGIGPVKLENIQQYITIGG